ncbi:hypothetical protein GOZ90_09655 [Agrobacterium vitis]|uniref:Lipoprotein n=1 Tax=Agrobacterium vitis TaxID=373 RepID=A0A6L6VFC6_AGRVI|nr:hypothetical protein [Agrobacterium vitis]MUZ72947.1 hypothetical protein [Agrobacterium vitis]
MNRSVVVALSGILFLCACQTVDQNQIWLRTDGKSQTENPTLYQQFDIDRTICVGETQKSAVGAPVVYSNGSLASGVNAAVIRGQQNSALNDVLKGCMAQKGYVLVQKDQAPAIAAQFRANSGKK